MIINRALQHLRKAQIAQTRQMRALNLVRQSRAAFASGTSVYLWNPNSYRQAVAGKGTKQDMQKLKMGVPTKIEAYDDLNVKKLKIGLRHSAVITEDGQLYTYGNGNWGVLGHGNEKNIRVNKPKKVEAFKNKEVVDVVIGQYFTMALTSDGNVYTWGYGGKKGYFNWMYA